MSVQILIGDCRVRMAELPDASVDSVVCDPPYHLTSIVKRFGSENAAPAKSNGATGVYGRASKGFMGQTWDGGDVAFQPETWAEVLRVLKPGGHLLAFSSTRTYHRMAVAIEDAGFEIRDCIFYHYGSGFPKSHNVGKKLDATKERCSCDKDLRSVRGHLDSDQSLSGCSQQDVRESLHGNADRSQGKGTPFAAQPTSDDNVRRLREASNGAEGLDTEGGDTNLFQTMQRLAAEQASGEVFGEHEGAEAGASIRGKQPGLEGRCDVETPEGELQRGSLRSSAGLGEANGPQGRLHHGTPPSDGADVRLPADADGSGEPQGPQPGEQPSIEPRALPNQRGSQAWGGWPVCGGCSKPIIPEGLGTALKPSTEPICLARKPLVGTVAANVLAHGTGALNIDGCRIETDDSLGGGAQKRVAIEGKHEGWARPWMHDPDAVAAHADRVNANVAKAEELGRWPANLCHDGSEEVLAGFPEARSSGHINESKSGDGRDTAIFGNAKSHAIPGVNTFNDAGSAARFFYCAKATTEERGEGNNHPTVKPIALMRWLIRLVTPKGGTVLDPFMGSGSTGLAADAEQFNFIGCEMSPEYAAIAERRIRDAAGMFAEVKAA